MSVIFSSFPFSSSFSGFRHPFYHHFSNTIYSISALPQSKTHFPPTLCRTVSIVTRIVQLILPILLPSHISKTCDSLLSLLTILEYAIRYPIFMRKFNLIIKMDRVNHTSTGISCLQPRRSGDWFWFHPLYNRTPWSGMVIAQTIRTNHGTSVLASHETCQEAHIWQISFSTNIRTPSFWNAFGRFLVETNRWGWIWNLWWWFVLQNVYLQTVI